MVEPRQIGVLGSVIAAAGLVLAAAQFINGNVLAGAAAVLGMLVFGAFAFMGLMAARPQNIVSDEVAAQIMALRPRRPFQHLVDFEMRDGVLIRRVYVGWGRYVNWSRRLARVGFDAREAVAARQSWPLQ
jgi:hypothetical protein